MRRMDRSTTVVLAGLALGGAACRPMAATMPATTLSRAQALPEGTSGIVVGGGAGIGGVGWIEGGGGGAARVRIAVTDGNEVDLSGQVIVHSCSGCSEEAGGKRGLNLSAGGRVGARIGLSRQASLIAGVGFAGGLTGRAAGIDGGLIHDLGERFYLSGRLGAAVPIDKDRYLDSDEERVTTTSTGYGVFAAGFRSLGPLGVVVELGTMVLGTKEEGGAAFYAAIGLEQIGRLW